MAAPGLANVLIGICLNLTLPASRTAVLTRLRAETRAEHDAIEQTLDLVNEDLTAASYRHRIEQFYGFYRPLEDRMRAIDSWLAPWLDATQRRKTLLLEQDLKVLGCTSPEGLPRCSDLPPLADPAAYFGCLYVLEGSTLGGQVIGRHIRDKLGVTAETGGRFFAGYGDQTGLHWQQFRSALTAFSAIHDADEQVIAAARSTFDRLTRWCASHGAA